MFSTAKNTFYLLAAYIYQKLISLVYFIVLARYLGADNFGKYTFALSFAALFSVLIEFGLSSVLTREIARDRKKLKEYFGNILSFCLIVGIFVLFLIYLSINFLGYPQMTKYFVYLTSAVIFFDTLSLLFYCALRGYLNTKYEALGIIVHKTVLLLVGLLLIFLKVRPILMILPLLVASCFYLGNAVFFFKRRTGDWPTLNFNSQILKFLIKLAWPFLIAAGFAKIYSTADTIILSYLSGDRQVGLYNAAQKLTSAFLLLIAGSLSAALYPSLSYYFVRSKEELKKLFKQAVFYLLFLIIPLVFGLIVLAKPIILFIYGQEYLSAFSILILLSLSIPFMFLDYIVASLLNACEKQRTNTFIHGAGTAIFLILNLILIPIFAGKGAAIAVLGGFLVIFYLEFFWVKKIIGLDLRFFLKKIGLIFVNSLLMGLVLEILKERTYLLVTIVSGAGFYFIMTYLSGLIKKEEIIFLRNVINFKKDLFDQDSVSNRNLE